MLQVSASWAAWDRSRSGPSSLDEAVDLVLVEAGEDLGDDLAEVVGHRERAGVDVGEVRRVDVAGIGHGLRLVRIESAGHVADLLDEAVDLLLAQAREQLRHLVVGVVRDRS